MLKLKALLLRLSGFLVNGELNHTLRIFSVGALSVMVGLFIMLALLGHLELEIGRGGSPVRRVAVWQLIFARNVKSVR